jgi:DEAD/DEAH box helicase domain-containing protein
MTQRVKNSLKDKRRGELARSVAAYAATFLDEDRATAEGRLRDGTTLAIVSTNALELGIDIPDLSLAVLVGYPGQISSFRQRIGRVGRTGPGVAVLIVGDDPLQQHLARDPETLEQLLTQPAETVIINPEAVEVARRYGLQPACAEFGGISFEDERFFGAELVNEWLADATGAPSQTIAGADYWDVSDESEQYQMLRSAIGGRSYKVIAQSGRDRTPIGTIDAVSAVRDAFVPAIWTGPEGDLYEVTGHDSNAGEIYCRGPLEIGYTTRGVPVDRVSVIQQDRESFTAGGTTIAYGKLEIVRQVFSYREQHFSGFEATKQIEGGWPALEFTTDGLILNAGGIWKSEEERLASVRAFEHVLLAAVPAIVACDPYDLDTSSDRDRVYLYDSFGGGIRISEAAYDRFSEVVRLGLSIVQGCSCSDGCPSCIMLGRKPNDGLSKAGAEAILSAMVEGANGLTSNGHDE